MGSPRRNGGTKIVTILGEQFEADDDNAVVIGTDGSDIPDYPVVVQRTEWQGEERLDIRRYYWNKDKGRFCRTRKGVPLPVRDLEELFSVAAALCPEVFSNA